LVANRAFAEDAVSRNGSIATPLNMELTALDKYVATPDPNFEWKIIAQQDLPQGRVYIIDLTSQKWLTESEVDRPIWKHWLTIVRPNDVKSNKALMFISGGGNDSGPPKGPDGRVAQIALATKSVVAEIKMIPNQPLVFHNDGVPRKEDDLVAYTWSQFLKTGDSRWPARLPMVKSVVRGMDVVQEVLREDELPDHQIDEFVVAGGSKRGWTTWMTAAVDSRVAAIMPIVIDVLNMDVSMRNHYSAYGFWAPAIDDYVHHKIMQRRSNPRYVDLMKLEDPFAYRDRFTMPKCIINATGDQFFCPDSSHFYFGELTGEKHLCYVPNGEHSLDGTDALDTLISFFYCIANDIPRPECSWSAGQDGTIHVKCSTPPKRAVLWQAVNEKARDFRVDTIGRAYKNTEIKGTESGEFTVTLSPPGMGWSASLVQCEFDVGAPTPMRLTTGVRILPDVLPFANKAIPTE
ncbi:MAG: PhoPQ-activated pathogenicity-related family protein, partial [Planctomycetales bacterium]|nr:PhoPQ-activated pathogenicity-related family protein [Planctomycetales bacterium]